MADLPYFDDPLQWGNYQYVTLETIVNDYMMARDQDDYTANVPRHKILYQVRQAFKEFYYDVIKDIKVMSLELSPESLSIPLPSDYVDYVRISYVDNNNMLQPMAANDKMNISAEYLQDNQYYILYDNNGCPLQDSYSYLTQLKNSKPTSGTTFEDGTYYYALCRDGFEPNINMANYYINGSYKIDKNKGIVQFDSTVGGKQIVLEYISDGLYTGCLGLAEDELRIHKFAEDAVKDSIYYRLIKQRRNVPANEKIRARKEYYNSRRLTKLRINKLVYSELIQQLKSQSKWIK